ncbi:zinc-dependent metalloprotease [Yimella sp. cx-51]|uniref:zinc-dependent metalloprotease n=1 Tax=Yimella sp. cx-51 TaxID=2770551 RepID=UPI00165DE0C4|nr:zinc-dependent metalloprotease [Yimella sp. cx-51]MBC9956400.1 zinc-dependent metalloprotease [Yimella sp. cx-51]QTH38482.1 zinc-dependent metalloprotease [Yimella sp. cx-51]
MSYVDWGSARSIGRRVAGSGIKVSLEEAVSASESLRDAAARAYEPVAQTAQLDTSGQPESPVRVIDRSTWVDINIDSFGGLVDPVIETLMPKVPGAKLTRVVTSRVAGAEAGGLLGFFSSKVLGQYDLAPQGQPSLLLVAPNIVEAERQLGVDPDDFRLWVCLHEETHRVQFTAVPWLRQHMIDGSRQLLTEIVPEPGAVPARVQEIATRLLGSVKDGGGGLADVFVNEEQRDRIAAMTAVMSLLEGHADVVMDDVGPQIVPSVEEIRRTFNERRKGAGNVDRLLRRLLGLEAKMRQYRDGAAFCRAVMDKVGVDGFNEVWTSPETLPSAREILEPSLWVERVHGSFIR